MAEAAAEAPEAAAAAADLAPGSAASGAALASVLGVRTDPASARAGHKDPVQACSGHIQTCSLQSVSWRPSLSSSRHVGAGHLVSVLA